MSTALRGRPSLADAANEVEARVRNEKARVIESYFAEDVRTCAAQQARRENITVNVQWWTERPSGDPMGISLHLSPGEHDTERDGQYVNFARWQFEQEKRDSSLKETIRRQVYLATGESEEINAATLRGWCEEGKRLAVSTIRSTKNLKSVPNHYDLPDGKQEKFLLPASSPIVTALIEAGKKGVYGLRFRASYEQMNNNTLNYNVIRDLEAEVERRNKPPVLSKWQAFQRKLDQFAIR
jgi:hypothetical protein